MQFTELYKELMKLDMDGLKEVADIVGVRISEIKDKEARDKTLSREEIIKTFDHFGYIVPKNAVFWKVMAPDDGFGGYGMEVGQYTHSCHIDTTDLKVLLVVNGDKHFTDSYADIWLKGPF